MDDIMSRIIRLKNELTPDQKEILVSETLNDLPEENRFNMMDKIMPREIFCLMFYDISLIQFKFSQEARFDAFSITLDPNEYFPNVDLKYLFPVRIQYDTSLKSFEDWLNRRALPVLRSSYKRVLKELNLTGRANILSHGFALSLNDVFWIKPKDNPVRWKDINLYEHEFSRRIANIAVGRVEYINERTDTTSSPEYTTSGILPKFWKREENGVFLYKQGERESAREVVAASILKILGIKHVEYTCKFLEGYPYSRCRSFTDLEIGHVPFFDVYAGRGLALDTVADYERLFDEVGVDFLKFREMILCDYIMCNVDRHFNNFGFSINNETNKVVGFSPLFDHGLCLFGKMEFTPDREIVLKSLPGSMDQLQFIRESVTPTMKDRIIELRGSCFKNGEIYDLCQDLLENRYWNRWSCDNSQSWIIKCCDVLSRNDSISTWNRYRDPTYMEIF